MKKLIALGAATTVAASVAFGADHYWKQSATTGFINDDSSWTDSAPAAGDRGKFGNETLNYPAEYLVKIPSGGFTDAAGTWVNGLPSGTKVTFDATGTVWTKQRPSGTAWADGTILRFDNSDHIFNMENVNAGNANDVYGFTLTDGRLSYTAADEGDTLAFESGVFNNYNPAGGAPEHTTIAMYSVHKANSRILFNEGSEAHLRQLEIRGQAPGGEVVVNGGDVHIYNGLNIKTYGTEEAGVLRVSAGKATLETGSLWIGHNSEGPGRLAIDGTGVFEHKGNAVYFPDVSGEHAYLDVSGQGVYVTSSAGMAAGHNGGYAHITVTDDGQFLSTNYVTLAEGQNGSADLTISSNGYMYVGFNLNAASAGNSSADITLRDSGELRVWNGGQFGGGADSTGSFTMLDDSVFAVINNWFTFGNNNNSVVQVNLLGGTVEGDRQGGGAGINAAGAPGSTFVIDGADVTVRNLVIEGPQNIPSTTNVVELKSGSLNVRTCDGGDGLDIRGNNRNTMFLMGGGELNIGGMIRLGHAGANNGYHSVFRQTNGVVRLWNCVNFCDNNPSDGEFELLGGRFIGKDIRGWSGAATRGGTGWAKCYFNGGTVEPYQAGVNLISTMDEARLGAEGLVVDTNGKNCRMMVKLQDAEGEDGLFVKAGAGTLTANLTETDGGARGDYVNRSLNGEFAYTEVLGGTLEFGGREDCVFGDNVTVGNGAVLSLSGTPTSLTVATLALGNGTGNSSIYLDQGDVIHITGEDGLTVSGGSLNGTWAATDGVYDVFVFDYEPPMAELNKLAVYNYSSAKAYDWSFVQDGEGRYVASLTIGPVDLSGSAVWNGSESSDWGAAANWDGALPVGNAVATFPAAVANQAVTTTEGAIAGKMLFEGGSYTVSGEDAIALRSEIEVAAGVQTVSAPLTLGRAAIFNAAAGAELDVTGSIDGFNAEITKTGSGKVVVGGVNTNFTGKLLAGGGVLEVSDPGAFGPDPAANSVALVGGTFRYDGDEPLVTTGALELSADAPKKMVIFDNDGDVAFSGVTWSRGNFAKTGAGVLHLDLPGGTFAMGSNSGDEAIGENGGMVSIPASGDAPDGTTATGRYGVNVYEGTLKVTGAGVDATKLQTWNSALVGGGYVAAAPAQLVVEDASVDWGAGSRHGMFCRDLPAGAPAPVIALTNAYVWSDGMQLGYSAAEVVHPLVLMKDSTFFIHYNCTIGDGANHAQPFIDADNSKLYNDAMFGVNLNGSFEADFHGPDAFFGCLNRDNMQNDWGNNRYPRAGAVSAWGATSGRLTIRDGAVYAVSRGIMYRNNDGCVVTNVFDGGVFEVRAHNLTNGCMSAMRNTTVQGFTTTGAGLTVRILDGVDHSITFPFFGDGKVVKTGAGVLRLVHSYDQRNFVDGQDLVDEAVPLLQHSGVTEVAEGTLYVEGGVIGTTAKLRADAGAFLDLNGSQVTAADFGGEGTVQNGEILAGGVAVTVADEGLLTFKDVVMPSSVSVAFDFGGVEPEKGATKAVCCIDSAESGHPAEFDVSHWTGTTVDEGLKVVYEFSYNSETGVVTAKFARTNGLVLFLR